MENKIYKVWQVNAYIKMCLDSEDIFHNIFVEGEISNFKYHSSGHMYFSIKDSKSTINCVCFKTAVSRLKFMPENGMKVIVQGNISVFEKTGSYQIYVDNMLPKGIGEISLGLEQLKEKLLAEGLFDSSRKQAIPRYVKNIGVITAKTGAVIQDICNVANKRNPYVTINLYSAKVQGEDAYKEIMAGIKFFNKNYPVDVIIIARGGGSKEDLWCFNEEKLVRAIADSNIPIITAIGHETDTTLADYAGDLRAATPSQAAEFAVADLKNEVGLLKSLEDRLNKLYKLNIKDLKFNLEKISNASILKDGMLYIENNRHNLNVLAEALEQHKKQYLKKRYMEIDYYTAQLEAFNPLAVLKRGYTAVKQKNKYISKLENLDRKKNFTLIFNDGECEVKCIEEIEVKEQN